MDREIIQTLIFMDFETAGPWLHSETNEELRPRDHIDDMDFTEHLAHLINTDVDPSKIPRIAEMSFVAVPRCLFEEAAENMAHRQRVVEEAIQKGICLKDESIKIDVATNLYTCQLNPGLREAEWKIYDLKKSSNRLRHSELLRKNSFAKEWPIVHLFLCNAPKPACLIAHNGLEYDFRILLHELKRFDMLNKYPIPAGVYFVDSLLSFVHIEGNHHSAIKLVFDNIDWDHVTNASQESILSSSSLHTDNVTDQAHSNSSNHEVERMEHNSSVTDLVDDNDDVQFIGADCPFVENEPNDDIEILENGQENPQYEKGENLQKQEEEIMVIGENLNHNLENDRKWRNGDSEDKKRFTDNEPHLLEADHPFQFLRRMDWCPAKRRRVPARIFNKYSKNQWYFSDQVSQLCLRQAGRYKLEKMYKNIIGVEFKAHRAQTDSEALLQDFNLPDFLTIRKMRFPGIRGNTARLSDGNEIPFIGLGTYALWDQSEVDTAIDTALANGYRLFDTANYYRNEKELGNAFKKLLPKYSLKRGDIFIVTKADIRSSNVEENAKSMVENSLRSLQTDYIDLMLIHYPKDWGVSDKNPKNSEHRLRMYQVYERYKDAGSIRSIGVSNFEETHILELWDKVKHKPVANQCEFHPHLTRPNLREFCKRKNIFFQAHTSLATQSESLYKDPITTSIAQKHNATIPQVLLAFAYQQNVGVIPKSKSPKRISSNMDLLKIVLSQKEIDQLNGLNRDDHYSDCDGWNVL